MWESTSFGSADKRTVPLKLFNGKKIQRKVSVIGVKGIFVDSLAIFRFAPQGIEIWAGDPRVINLTTNHHSRVERRRETPSKKP
jgi:hypothetical protein